MVPPGVPEWLPEIGSPGELPFYESYFSNYIKCTTFTVDEARRIVETNTPPAERPADGHDVLGTYRCVVDPPQSFAYIDTKTGNQLIRMAASRRFDHGPVPSSLTACHWESPASQASDRISTPSKPGAVPQLAISRF